MENLNYKNENIEKKIPKKYVQEPTFKGKE